MGRPETHRRLPAAANTASHAGALADMRDLGGRIDNLRDELHRDHARLDDRLQAIEVRLGPASS